MTDAHSESDRTGICAAEMRKVRRNNVDRHAPSSLPTRPPSLLKSFIYGLGAALVLFLLALSIGWMEGRRVATLSLIGTGIVLECQPGAALSIPLGFSPLTGAIVSILANLIPIPMLMLTFQQVIHRWKWFRKKLMKAAKWTQRYGRHGVWILIPLCPFLGAYVCISLGFGMRWRWSTVFASVFIGMVSSTFFLTYGGHWVVNLFHWHFIHRFGRV